MGDRSGTWSRVDDDEKALVHELCELIAGVSEEEIEEDDGSQAMEANPNRQRPWLRRVDPTVAVRLGHERWRIDFEAMAASIKHALLEDLILRRFGDRGKVACRLVNLVAAKGYIDEKQARKAFAAKCIILTSHSSPKSPSFQLKKSDHCFLLSAPLACSNHKKFLDQKRIDRVPYFTTMWINHRGKR